MVSSQSLSDSLQITVGLTKEHGGLSWFHFVCELDVIGWGEGGGGGAGRPNKYMQHRRFFLQRASNGI